MERILIFSGTTEGRQLAEFLQDYSVEVLVSVATEYGKECTGIYKNTKVLSGRMGREQMEQILKERGISLVIDATHPFAQIVTENIRSACEAVQVPYIRCLREPDETCLDEMGIVWVGSVREAVEYLKQTQGNIFISTGSKELKEYTEIPNYKERCYTRVLSTLPAVEESVRLGFEGAHLIAMQGPFSVEMNLAVLRQIQAAYFVTKESGKSGGFAKKAEAARQTGAVLVVIGRPKEDGMEVQEVLEYLRNNFHKNCKVPGNVIE